jgi:spoIIIJ-associated protein
MSQLRSIEVSAADIESAIDKGIADLGVSRDEVMVEVLEEPVRRLLGLGARQAKVRLTIIRAPAAPPPPPSQPSAPPAPRAEERERGRPARQTHHPRQAKPAAPARSAPAAQVIPPAEDIEFEDELAEDQPALSVEELAEDAKIGVETLRELLKRMEIEAKVTSRAAETTEDEPQHWTLEIQGLDLGVLIGRRGETLAALQYITRLIASRKLGRRAHIVIDVEGYKSRRESMLKRLAKRMADQAIQRGRTVSLEPMPPHERRIIHLTLRDNPQVTTESVGEGDRRKVTIIPRRDK